MSCTFQEDSKEYKNLFTSDGLCPTYKDLDQIFDNSDDAASGDETVRLVSVQTFIIAHIYIHYTLSRFTHYYYYVQCYCLIYLIEYKCCT